MTVCVDVWHYRLPLARPLILAQGGRLDAREGLWFIHRRDNRCLSLAEAAPLPGFSRESLDELIRLVRQAPSLSALVEKKGEFPSLFAAIWTLNFPTLIFESARNTELMAAYQPQNSAGQAVESTSPTRAIKVKLTGGHGDIQALTTALKAAGQVRVDPNRRWTPGHGENVLSRFSADRFDYLEEPCATLEESVCLSRLTGIPLGLDETTRECTPEALLDRYPLFREHAGMPAPVLVLKPMLLGARLTGWINFARKRHWRVIISSTYESPLGLSMLQRLAHQWFPDETHGLGTEAIFPMRTLSVAPGSGLSVRYPTGQQATWVRTFREGGACHE